MKTYILKLDQLDTIADEITKKFKSGVVILMGDLAAGKTTLVKAVVKKLGLNDEVTSPTFSLQHCYGDKVFHYDIYNKGLNNFISLGMLEELEKDGLHLVEWGDDKLKDILTSAGFDVMIIEIQKLSDDAREYKVKYA